MKTRYALRRLSPEFDGRWLIALVVIGVGVAAAASFLRWGRNPPPILLLALDPGGRFADTVSIPAAWGDTSVATPDAVARVPLILGVRNSGTRVVQPERLQLGVPVRYRLTGPGGGELETRTDPASPLVSYTLEPRLPPLQPQRLPTLLPAYDTLWLEVIIPEYYCVALADSIPEFVSAPPAPLSRLGDVRIFYSFSGGDLEARRTGTLSLRIDTTLLERPVAPPLPSFPMRSDRTAARPDLGTLAYVGSRKARCGEPEDPMELLSSVWETPSGGRLIALDYGGTVRKNLYDLDGDGIIDRESWDPDGDGVFDATRRARMPIPDFLLPAAPPRFDMAAIDTLPPDSQRALDPFRGAMPGPGAIPGATPDSAAALFLDSLPQPRIEPAGPRPLGRPARIDTGGG